MQAIVDKVMRAFTFKAPNRRDEEAGGRQEATEFAVELFENYKTQLAGRTLGARRG